MTGDEQGRHHAGSDAIGVEAGRSYAADLQQTVREAAQKAESLPAEAEQRAAGVARRFLWPILAAMLVVLVAVVVLCLYTLSTANQTSTDLTQSGLAGRSQARLDAAERDFDVANDEWSSSGFSRVPDPPTDPNPSVTADRLVEATGSIRGALLALGEAQKRGVDLPGVVLPDPISGRFPGGTGPAAPTTPGR